MNQSRLHLAVGRLRARLVLSMLGMLAIVALLSWATDRYGLALSEHHVRLQLWALALFGLACIVPLAVYTRSALDSVVSLLQRLRDRDRDGDHSGDPIDAPDELADRAREAALRFPTGFIVVALSLFAALLPIKLVVDIAFFELPAQIALALAVRLMAFALASTVVLYMLIRGWTRPVVAHLRREAVPHGLRFTARARLVFALVSLALVAAVPMMMFGGAATAASVGAKGRTPDDDPALRSAFEDRKSLARVLAHGASFANSNALREQVAGLGAAHLHVFFSAQPGDSGARLPAGRRAAYLRVEPRGPATARHSAESPRDIAVLLLLVALLVGLAAYLASDVGWTLERDLQYVSASVSALADEGHDDGGDRADEGAGEAGRDDIEGEPPTAPAKSAPLASASVQFAELRDLADAVNGLLERMAEMHIAHYVAVEKTLEADQMRTQFLANMSHDLRSPLNSILGFAELLLSGHEGDVTAGQRRTLETMQSAGRHLLRLIDSVLDAAKLDAGRYAIHREAVPATTLLNKALELAHAATGDDGIAALDSELQAGMPVLEVDQRRLSEAIARVLVYCRSGCAPDGHVKLRLGVKRPARADEGDGDGDADGPRELPRLWFEVTDNSRDWVPAEAAEELFVGFRRRKGRRGLGLDLPLARAVVERHGGTLTLQPRDDVEGNRFYGELPLEQRRAIGRLRPVRV